MDGVFYTFAVLLFAAVILLIEGAYLWWAGNYGGGMRRIARRLRMMSDGPRSGVERISILKQRRYSRDAKLDRLLQRMPLAHRIDKLLQQAGVKWSIAQFGAWSIGLLCCGVLIALLWPAPLLVRVAIALAPTCIPYGVLRRARRLRLVRIEAQLPEAADFLARALRAGHSFSNVLQMVGNELAEPLGAEFRIAHEEINYGVAMHEALANLATRVPLTDLRYLVIAVLIQREAGGNLAEILGNISHIIRERLKLLGHVRVLSAEGRMSAWVLGLLPFGLLLVMTLASPDYVSVLWTDPTGVKILWCGAGMMLCGVLWLRKLIQIRI